MKVKTLILFGVFLICTFLCIAQSNPGNIGPSSYEVQLVPPNPEVANLGKFGAVPVNKYNGTANVTVPIHTVVLDGLQIPLNLSYNTGGIRVNQDASWVGLGWNLSDGITITREVNGFEDIRKFGESGTEINHLGWIYSEDPLFPTQENTQFELDSDELFALDIAYQTNNKLDLEPDLFSVNLPSGSFKFYLPKITDSETELNAFVIGERNFKVTFIIATKNFIVLDPNGFTYIFNEKEFSTSLSNEPAGGNYSHSNDLDALKFMTSLSAADRLDMISSWKVSQIQSPYNDPSLNNAVLNFSYERIFSLSFPNFSENYSLDTNSPTSPTNDGQAGTISGPTGVNVTITAFKNLCLDEISGSFGAVRFIKGEREDMYNQAAHEKWTNSSWNIQAQNPNNYTTPKRLEQITVVDLFNNTVKSALLNYSYFNDDEYQSTNPNLIKEKYLRLKLDKVTILDQEYEFTYFQPNELPTKDSKDIDFWGFYNEDSDPNTPNNSHRIPGFNRFLNIIESPAASSEDVNEQFFLYHGANRKSYFNSGKIGLLTNVKYPTKGTTEFVYEANKVTLQNKTYTPTYRSNGVLRNSNLTSSEAYNFKYQQLKIAADPSYSLYDNAYMDCDYDTSSTPSNNTFTINQAPPFCSSGPTNYNIEVTANLQCNSCGDASPSGMAVWVENVASGQKYPVADYDFQFSNGSQVSVVKELNLPLGDYQVKTASWSGPGGTTTVFAIASATSIVWNGISITPPMTVYEEFEVGGARIQKMINRDYDGSFITSKEFVYEQDIADGSQKSSGVLMDDLVYWSPPSSIVEYAPDMLINYFANNGLNILYVSSDNKLRTNNSAAGSHVGYNRVIEKDVDTNGVNNGYSICSYINTPNEYLTRNVGISQVNLGCGNACDGDGNFYNDNFDAYDHLDVSYGKVYLLGGMVNTYNYINGSIAEQTLYKSNGAPVQQTINTYREYSSGNVPFTEYPILFWKGPTFFPANKPYEGYRINDFLHRNISRIEKSINTAYFEGNNVVTTTDYFYENSEHYQLTKMKTIDSKGDILTTKAFYPQDTAVESFPLISDLISVNRTNGIIQSEVYNTDASTGAETLVNWQRTSYTDTKSPVGIIMADSVLTKKGDNPIDFRQVYELYDDKGNLLQYRKADGTSVSMAWSFNKDYLVAEAENIDSNTLNNTISTALQSAGTSPIYSSLDALLAATTNIRTDSIQKSNWDKFNIKLRELLSTTTNYALITTYTYDPLVGVTSVTDPRGYTMYYEYDEFNRLQYVRDADNKLISENQYNYKNQN